MLFNIEDVYKYNKYEAELPMLSAYPADFWKEYRENKGYFDRLFMKTYRSFIPFNSTTGLENIDEVANDFRADIYAWLLANDKRYSELYRVQLVTDEDDPITFNYDLKEEYSGSSTRTGTDTQGARTDQQSDQKVYGQQSRISDYDEVQGQHTDSIEQDNTYGSQSNSRSKDFVYDDVVVENENKVSAFNDSGYAPKDFSRNETGSRNDSETEVESLGSHTDNLDTTTQYGSQTITKDETVTDAAHTDTGSTTFNKGSQNNSSAEASEDEHELRRYGNIGVQTTSDIMTGHIKLWDAYSFYKIIFDDIANEFLRVF